MAQVLRILYWGMLTAGLSFGAGGRVEGTVVNSVTGAAIAGVEVRLALHDTKGVKFRTWSGASGEFRFDEMAPDEYSISLDKDGFDTPDSEAGDTVRVPAQGTVRLREELEPLTTITGKVLDAEGKGVKRIRVEVVAGRGQTRRTASTDDAGGFRIGEVHPGVYLLRATPDRPAWEKTGTLVQLTASAAAASLTKRPLVAPVYYPNVRSRAEASPILVNGERELSGCDIRMPAVVTFAIRGRVISPEGDPVAKAKVKLKSADTHYMFEDDPPDAEVVSGSEGEFEFAAVTPGQWHLIAEGPGQNPGKLMSFLPLLMTRGDREDVTLRLTPPFHLNVTLEGIGKVDPRETVVVVPVDGPLEQQVFASPSKVMVYPGRYRVDVSRRKGYYLDSILLGERNVQGQEVELMEGAAPVRIVYKTGGGVVRGKVDDGEGCTAVVVPDADSRDYWAPARCDEQGRFEVGDLRPGDYFVVALRRSAALQDPEFATLVEREGKRVHVEAGEVTAVDLGVTGWPR